MAMKVTYPNGSTELLKEAVNAKKTKSDTMEFYDRDGRIVKTIRFVGLLHWETTPHRQ